MESCVERASRVAKSILRPKLREDQWLMRLVSKAGAEERALFETLVLEFRKCGMSDFVRREIEDLGDVDLFIKRRYIQPFYDTINNGKEQRINDTASTGIVGG
jgi:hypothetical protein